MSRPDGLGLQWVKRNGVKKDSPGKDAGVLDFNRASSRGNRGEKSLRSNRDHQCCIISFFVVVVCPRTSVTKYTPFFNLSVRLNCFSWYIPKSFTSMIAE